MEKTMNEKAYDTCTAKLLGEVIATLSSTSELHRHVAADLVRDSADYPGDFATRLQARCAAVMRGCHEGEVPELIYDEDTAAFFARYREDIEKMLELIYADTGTPPWDLPDFDREDPFLRRRENQNVFAWFAYSEVARQLAELIPLEG